MTLTASFSAIVSPTFINNCPFRFVYDSSQKTLLLSLSWASQNTSSFEGGYRVVFLSTSVGFFSTLT